MLAMKLTAYQSITLFGLARQPVLTLSWADIKTENFTWRELRALDLPAEDLKKMQPDKNEWLQRGGVGLEDLKDMVVFPVNPLTDFAVDLAELWKMQCSVDEMLKMGIHYDHLVFGLWRICFPPILVRTGRRLPVQALGERGVLVSVTGYPRGGAPGPG